MARSCFEVRTIEFRFKNNVLEADTEKKMTQIEEKFFLEGICGFRISSRSYAKIADDYNKIKFEFTGEGSNPIIDAIEIFGDWPEVVQIKYTVNLEEMVILIV